MCFGSLVFVPKRNNLEFFFSKWLLKFTDPCFSPVFSGVWYASKCFFCWIFNKPWINWWWYYIFQRNLKIMVNMGLSAKQEKESRFQQIKKQVADMVRIGIQALECKVSFTFLPPSTSPTFAFWPCKLSVRHLSLTIHDCCLCSLFCLVLLLFPPHPKQNLEYLR